MYIALSLTTAGTGAGYDPETLFWWDAGSEKVETIIERISVMAKKRGISLQVGWVLAKSNGDGFPMDVKIPMLRTIRVVTPKPDPYMVIWTAVITAATRSDIGRWHAPRQSRS